jgi:hypothetical protein
MNCVLQMICVAILMMLHFVVASDCYLLPTQPEPEAEADQVTNRTTAIGKIWCPDPISSTGTRLQLSPPLAM